MQQAVLFIFYNQTENKILSEQRLPNHLRFPNQKTFPTGKIEEGETIVEALLREAHEEFGIIPKVYDALPTVEGSVTLLHPFWIKEWEGELPDAVLDIGSPLVWETLQEAADSPIPSRAKIINSLKTYLTGSPK